MSKHEYRVSNYILIWDFDEKEPDISKASPNNLYIDGLWSMSEFLGREELCVGVNIIDSNTFRFTTYLGMSYEMKITGDKVDCISKMFVK